MSGGHFNHDQYRIGQIADMIEDCLYKNSGDKEDAYYYGFTEETIAEFNKAIEYLKIAQIYAQRIDWLVSGDDGEETFHKRLKNDLEGIYPTTRILFEDL